MNYNKSAIPDFSETNNISYESSISQLFGDIFNIQLMQVFKEGGQNDYNNAGSLSGSVARMTSQISL